MGIRSITKLKLFEYFMNKKGHADTHGLE